ncbi:MAG: serine/threonine protein kinase [Anaerolineae bacterium]|nr:serine/threonine protein kinase [Anaerolineae bacterium]
MSALANILNNRYQLLSQYGSGGMSVVYRAMDLALGRQVAVKILRPSLTSDPVFLERFRQEARNVANLQHPQIVTVHDVGQDGNTYYIVMELIEGDDLKKLIRAEAPLPIDRALDIAIKICAGIGYAHRAGLVHADVKPQNVLMLAQDQLKVTDFGIAQALAASRPNERQKVVWGSPHYFAPEQARGEYPTPAADVYSIGVVLFEMLTGRLPFTGADQQELAMAHIKQPVPSLLEINPNIPENLDKIVQKVLSKAPEARYRMADQLGRILSNYRDQGRSKTANNAPPAEAPMVALTAPLPTPTPPPCGCFAFCTACCFAPCGDPG